MSIHEALNQSQPGLQKRLERAIESQPLSSRTQQIYLHWISRFVLFHDMPDPDTLETSHAWQFLAELNARLRVSRARRNQASNALSFFYQDVLNHPDPWSGEACFIADKSA